MNQNNSREEIINKRVERYGMAYEGILPKESIDRSKEHWRNELLDFADEITQTFHQELQKARHDWLREEIVKLEWMKIKELPSSLDDTTGFVMGHSKNITLQTIIDRYQSELDQPTCNRIGGHLGKDCCCHTKSCDLDLYPTNITNNK